MANKKKALNKAAKPTTAKPAKPAKPAKVTKPAKPAKAAAVTKPAKPAMLAKPAKAAKPSHTTAREVAGLVEGNRVPDFSADSSAGPVTLSKLLGKPFVLYFYPKDDTPGCTREACGFRDNLPAFEKLAVTVLGVSTDSLVSHERFKQKYKLNFNLIADTEKLLAKAFGAWVKKQNYGREYMGINRSTFLVDAKGVIAKVWRNVKVDGHVEQVLAAVKALQPSKASR
jgi:peroxiredoxin Q/BCP